MQDATPHVVRWYITTVGDRHKPVAISNKERGSMPLVYTWYAVYLVYVVIRCSSIRFLPERAYLAQGQELPVMQPAAGRTRITASCPRLRTHIRQHGRTIQQKTGVRIVCAAVGNVNTGMVLSSPGL